MLQTRIILFLLFSEVLLQREHHDGIDLHFQQSDYKVILGPLVLIRCNNQYVKPCIIQSFKYNRTATGTNFTLHFLEDIGKELEIVVQAYRFASNEYRLFPLRFQFNLCAAIATNAFGTGDMHKCGNFTGCSIKKGITYRLCNWAVDYSKYPPYIPSGQYMLELQATFHDKELLMCRGYGEVTRPIPWV